MRWKHPPRENSLNKIETLNESNRNEVLNWLLREPIENALAIQDLRIWPKDSKFYFLTEPFSYVHVSGHPAHHGSTTISLGGDSAKTMELLNHFQPQAPFVVRETDAKFAAAIRSYYPATVVYDEIRMDVTRESFKSQHRGQARQLLESDAASLAAFFGAPPQAVGRFLGWLKGAKAFYGTFEGEKLAALGSSFIAMPETWNLVSIATHKDFRGRGFATEVTSALVARGLEETKTVTVTVVSDNLPALKTYGKVGFIKSQDRIWADCGANSHP